MYYLYVLRLDGEQFYIGITSDLRRRVKEHKLGVNKSTKGRKIELVYYEFYVSKSYVYKRERKLKNNGRMRKFLLDRIKESLE